MTIEPNRADIDTNAAIARVSEAEIAAQADAKRCHEEAEAIRMRAGSAVRELEARTDSRLIRIRQRMRTKALREVERLDSSDMVLERGGAIPVEGVEAAAERLARELIGLES